MRLPHWPRAISHLLLLGVVALSGCDSCAFGPNSRDAGNPPYDVGLLPQNLVLEWPSPPEIDRELVVRTDADVENGFFESNTRLRVRGDIDLLLLDADDVEVVVDRGVRIESVLVSRGRRRIHFIGGTYGEIVLEPPHLIPPPPEWRAEGMIEDVLFESITVDSGNPAMSIRGRRVALLRSRVSSAGTAFYVGDTTPIPSEDIVVADCVLESSGAGPTLVLNQVERAVVVDSWLINPTTFGYVVSGTSDWTYAASNTFVGGGASIGTRPGSNVDVAWFWVNTIYHSSVLLALDPAHIRELHLVSNTIFSDRVTCAWCATVLAGWNVAGNRVSPYERPPPPPLRP